jgi:hypothetical protein
MIRPLKSGLSRSSFHLQIHTLSPHILTVPKPPIGYAGNSYRLPVVVSLGSRRLHKLTGHCKTTKVESVSLLFQGFHSPARA